ncbi:MAG TPA: S53 family serine peptidase [Acidobacteriaceae bacterium]|nr:S53 family serine peptidase [Acidobacteriaceae bacterium]
MYRRTVRFLLTLTAILAVGSLAANAQYFATRHVRDAVRSGQAVLVGRMPESQLMTLNVVLPLTNQAGLNEFLRELYDPNSPTYHHYLTPTQFTALYGPSVADYNATVAYLKANGFTVIGGSRDGMNIIIRGSVSSVESAFHVTMSTYRHPSESRNFYSPDREPTTSLSFELWHVSGMDNYSIPHAMLVKKSDYARAHGMSEKDVVPYATTGSGPSASFLGSDMRAAYYGSGSLTGAGQNLGLLEYYGTDLTDLTTYFTNAHQTNNVPVTLLSTDGTSTSCVYKSGCDDTEQTLDMTQAIGMAPGLASLTMYIGSTDTAIIATMTTHSPLPTTIGCSWGWTPDDPSTLDPYFEKMAAQGQNFFAASGDSSTWSSHNEAWPADDANVVSVGGTDLTTSSAAGPWKSETAWSDSGGGISPDKIAIPSWQQLSGVINSSNKGSTTYRNGPDVAANANFTFYVCADQTTCTANEYGGTSFATPMWAAYIALVNQQLVANGQSTIGFLDPTIYAQNVTSSYSADFHDITSGTSGSYSAVTGYDLVTGWGSPNSGLIAALTGSSSTTPSFSLSASPSSLSVAAGSSGTSTVTSTVSGGFDSAITLSSSGAPSGVTVGFSPSSITGAGTSTATFTVASTTTAGTYSITLTGTSGSTTSSTTVSLTVTSSAIASLSVSASPTSLTIDRGSSSTTTITTVASGINAAVSLSASGLGSGETASFSPSSIASPGSGTSTLTIKTTSRASTGTRTITITASGGGKTATTTISVDVVRSAGRG